MYIQCDANGIVDTMMMVLMTLMMVFDNHHVVSTININNVTYKRRLFRGPSNVAKPVLGRFGDYIHK